MKYFMFATHFVIPGNNEDEAVEDFLESYLETVANLFSWDIREITKKKAESLGYPVEDEEDKE